VNEKKKLQVFISSTFIDLREERQAAVATILRAGHIPAGMELFNPGDVSQWKLIHSWIEESDAYMLILGARYGSIEPESGLSYTEAEYDLAIHLKKPFFALVLTDEAVKRKQDLGLVCAKDAEYSDQLSRFRRKVLSRTEIGHIEDAKDIKTEIAHSLPGIAERPEVLGWIRPPQQGAAARPMDESAAMLLAVRNAKAALDSSVQIVVQSKRDGSVSWVNKRVTSTWQAILSSIAANVIGSPNENHLSYQLAMELGGFASGEIKEVFRISPQDWGTIKARLLRLDLVSIEDQSDLLKHKASFWTLTPLGKQLA
jgi:hypothetical protein